MAEAPRLPHPSRLPASEGAAALNARGVRGTTDRFPYLGSGPQGMPLHTEQVEHGECDLMITRVDPEPCAGVRQGR